MSDAPATTTPLPAIPTDDIAEALLHLRRPFTAGAVKWKVQITGPKEGAKTWATVVGYIDARLVTERLNAVVAGGWQEGPPVLVEGNANLLRYYLTVLGQTHTDIGEGQGQKNKAGMIAKARDSDALKRAAVKFGVGAYLYAMPPFSLFVTPEGEVKDDKPTLARMKDGKAGYLKDQHEEWLRNAYEEWLQTEGIAKFGEPLDHGDAAAGSVGGLVEVLPGAEPEDDTPVELVPEALTDEKADQLRVRIEAGYAELVAINPNRLAQGRYEKMLRDAAHSHDELDRVALAIETLRDTEKTLAELRAELVELVGEKAAKPKIDAAERRGSQGERIESLQKAISAIPRQG